MMNGKSKSVASLKSLVEEEFSDVEGLICYSIHHIVYILGQAHSSAYTQKPPQVGSGGREWGAGGIWSLHAMSMGRSITHLTSHIKGYC